jgi:hypothetical protein
MPDLDLPPGDYRERKPKGWRWKLPWSHPEDSKIPLVGLLVALGWLVFIFINRNDLTPGTLYGGVAMFGAIAGCLFAVAFRE